MKVYICGNKHRIQEFEHAENLLRKCGYIPINPVKVLYALPEEISNSDFTVIAFEIIRICDAVYFLEGWETDFLSRMEASHAKRNECEIITDEKLNMEGAS